LKEHPRDNGCSHECKKYSQPAGRKLIEIQFYFSDRINQASLKSFALAGGMDRIEKYDSKINPDNPARPGIA
jgi:hypothetical protein